MNVNCIICFGSLFSEAGDSAAAPCGHVFHNNCIRPWINQSKKCPLCKRPATLRQLLSPLYFSTTDGNETAESSSSSSDLSKRTRDLQVQLASSSREVESLRNELQLVRMQTADHILRINTQDQQIRKMTNSMRYLKQVKRVADMDDYLSSPTSQSFMRSLQNQSTAQLITSLGGLEYRCREAVRGRDAAETKLAINERAVNSLRAKNEKLKERLREFEQGKMVPRHRPRRKFSNIIVLDSEDEGRSETEENDKDDVVIQDEHKQDGSTEDSVEVIEQQPEEPKTDEAEPKETNQPTSVTGNTLYQGIINDLAFLTDDEEYTVEEHVSPMHNRFQYKRTNNNDYQLQAAGRSPKRLKPSTHHATQDDDLY